ncbi:hypothetical protein BDM02DRAFT_3111788 [Thelephora ganbajun]|uniref:Uncharacterized protein n=1 Tax=Thelephora ganbajun TaxID=370292 RepID=A0ACB6ZMJ5_THEGA|nr:hypothetical protein BDM02DRAFT_3111788 [Thelephora ganbajun]
MRGKISISTPIPPPRVGFNRMQDVGRANPAAHLSHPITEIIPVRPGYTLSGSSFLLPVLI